MTMKIKLLTLAAVILGLMATSCVSSKKYAELQGKYDDLQTEYNSTREQLITTSAEARNLTSQLEVANKSNDELKQGMSQLKHTLDKSL